MTLLSVDHLSVMLRGRAILRDVSFRVAEGDCIGLIGPNGAGKTTLMRAALGLLPATGTSSLAALPPDMRARAAAWMPQARQIAWPVTVERLVMLGRTPHLRGIQGPKPADHAHVEAALATMGLHHLRHRTAMRLSGGEQAMVLIARALAQDTPLLMADEPIAGLDPANQIATMRVFARLAGEGRAVIASIHDLGLAARHCTRLILLGEGGIVADGPPAEVLTPDHLARIFRVTAHYAQTAQGPVFQPLEVIE
ncbi:iron complex transport system ATP-binding protein [Roseovarius azorensis]|uniref:Iron complex transport system ATP-binding protein n=1 Tax=Roseovarius azorensis TaxID=1287727 RepID=A0A1H7HU60_9RHOB|nr:ABC transporter ATP-binding protein [Roseovarius azorensis]SEK52610.1 iron complex transport system ATP-binding protein [Roseovarius azorensis]